MLKNEIKGIIENILNNDRVMQILSQVGRENINPVGRVSNLIGEVYTYCFVHNDGSEIDIDDIVQYLTTMRGKYFECYGKEEALLDARVNEIGKSIAKKLCIDISSGTISQEEEQKILEYFLKNYVENGYVMHSFSGACEKSIRECGFSSTKRIWDNAEIMRIAKIFEGKDVLSPVGGYSHYSGGGMYVENNPASIYWHALSAPEWFKWFTSANHNKNSSKIEDSPYYLKDYDGCRQNVFDLCVNSGLNEQELIEVMTMFEKNWITLGTEKMCVALIPKSIIGKANIEDAIVSGQSLSETIKTVLSDGRRQYTEHHGNVLQQTITENDMLIMELPNAREIFREHTYKRETKEALYDPELVLNMIYRGTKQAGFELSPEKINSVIQTLRDVHRGNPQLEIIIEKYNRSLFSPSEIGEATVNVPTVSKDVAKSQVCADEQQVLKQDGKIQQ